MRRHNVAFIEPDMSPQWPEYKNLNPVDLLLGGGGLQKRVYRMKFDTVDQRKQAILLESSALQQCLID